MWLRAKVKAYFAVVWEAWLEIVRRLRYIDMEECLADFWTLVEPIQDNTCDSHKIKAHSGIH